MGRQNQLSGDWDGARKYLSHYGIDIRSRYIGESATVYAGGNGQGSDYSDDLSFFLDAKLKRTLGWKGTTFHFSFDRRHGGSASANFLANNILAVQENYGAGETNRITEFSIDKSLLHKRMSLKVGDFIMGNDFARTAVLCDYENLGFCAHAESLPNDAAWTDWPTAELGARLRIFIQPNFYLEVAAYEANAQNKKSGNGLNLSFDGATGAIFPLELSLNSYAGAKALPGTYKLGSYYDTSEAKDVNQSGQVVAGRYGGWLLTSQQIASFSVDNSRGVNLYLQGTLSDKPSALMTSYLLAAAIAQGPMRRRPHDYVNLGCVHAGVNPRALRAESMHALEDKAVDTTFSNAEIACEAGYGWQFTPALSFHPNFQYVRNPAAFTFGHVPNGWVFGTMTKVNF
ncbi:carbohydrate porin [Telmatobacter bradus]|uniref:carbohydrate porin n=1 Tax=Telmatobacter bradus TaxID=474953 RepID=UPI003B437B53